MSSSFKSDNNYSLEIEELLQIGTRCRALRKEKDMLRESQSESFSLIRRLELHVNKLSEACFEDKKRIQELETELKNCFEEIDYLQDQLNEMSTEVAFLREELKRSNADQQFLIQKLDNKEIELRQSNLCIEELEESISSIALESQCEIEGMKLDLVTLEQSLFEAKKSQEDAIQEKASVNGSKDVVSRFMDAQKFIGQLERENKKLREYAEIYERKSRLICQKIEEQFKELVEKKCRPRVDAYSLVNVVENKLLLSKEVSDILRSNFGETLGAFISKLLMGSTSDADLKDKTERLSNEIQKYEVLVSQLKEELREEKLKAKEEAEDLTQEMAELRYQMNTLLEEEQKRRACIEQASLQRIAELEAQIQKGQRKSSTDGAHLSEAERIICENCLVCYV